MNSPELEQEEASLADLREAFGIREQPIDTPLKRLHSWALVCAGGAINVVRLADASYSWDMRPRAQKNGAVLGRCYVQRRGQLPRDIGGYKIDAGGRVVQLPADLRAVLPGGLEAEISADVQAEGSP